MYPYPTYTMPDGSKAFTRPKDGEKFSTKDGTVWMWDGLYDKWLRYQEINGAKYAMEDGHPDFDQDMELARKHARCECGSEKVKSPIHSSWCPKYST